MVFQIQSCLYIFIFCFKPKYSQSVFIPKNSIAFINTLTLTHLDSFSPRNKTKLTLKKTYPAFKHKRLFLKPDEDLKGDFSRSLSGKYEDFSDYRASKSSLDTNIPTPDTFRNALVSNAGTLIMVSIYLIKIFRVFVYARAFLDSLVHINPYLPPFNMIYETTNFYMKILEAMPDIMGVNVFSQIPWFLLASLERYLYSLLGKNP